jgi:hypothetical protein
MVNLENITKKTGKFLRNSALGIALLATPVSAIEKYMEIQVLDATTHLPIRNAFVSSKYYINNNTKEKDWGKTNEDGYITLKYGDTCDNTNITNEWKKQHKKLTLSEICHKNLEIIFQDDCELFLAEQGQKIDGLTIEKKITKQTEKNPNIKNNGWDKNTNSYNYYLFETKIYLDKFHRSRW